MKTLEEIKRIREEKRKELDLRVNKGATGVEKHILVCQGSGCTSSKSPKIFEEFKRIIEEENIPNVRVVMTGCFGLCSKGPIVVIRPEDTFYSGVKEEDCREIIDKDIVNHEIVERLLCKDIDNTLVQKLDDFSFYKKQKRVALKNCGVINPEEIDEYIFPFFQSDNRFNIIYHIEVDIKPISYSILLSLFKGVIEPGSECIQ